MSFTANKPIKILKELPNDYEQRGLKKN